MRKNEKRVKKREEEHDMTPLIKDQKKREKNLVLLKITNTISILVPEYKNTKEYAEEYRRKIQ